MEEKPPEFSKMPSDSSVRRFKFIWRAFLISNFALAAYIFSRPRKEKPPKKKSSKKRPDDTEVTPPTPPPMAHPPPPHEEPAIAPPRIAKRAIIRDPIPEGQQREIFKWILEEKRKVKPQNKEEKKRIDEEKAILKQFIRSEFIPKF